MGPGTENLDSTSKLGKKKKNKASVTIAVCCAILAVAGVTFGIFGMTQGMNMGIQEQKEQILAVDDKDDEGYIIYYELVEKYIVPYIHQLDDVLEGQEIVDDFKALVAFRNASFFDFRAGEEDGYVVVSEEYLLEKTKELFGESIEPKDWFGTKCYYLERRNGAYRFGGGCGGRGYSKPIFDVIDKKEDGDTLSLTIAYGTIGIAGSLSSDSKIEYSLWSGKNGGEIPAESTYDVGSEAGEEEMRDYFYKHMDEFIHYTLTFKKTEKHYYLVGSTRAE